jgi:hypothetical protein
MKPLLVTLALAAPALLQGQQNDYATSVLDGISNRGQNGGEPYVTAGDRAYLIGTQDGNFPDLGDHVPGEMGGLWVHPIKLIDGFDASAMDSATKQEAQLAKSIEFINYPYGNRFKYGEALDGLEIERFQFSPDGQPGIVVQYEFKNSEGHPRDLWFHLIARSDLRPVWLSEKIGITDAPDSVAWQPASGR